MLLQNKNRKDLQAATYDAMLFSFFSFTDWPGKQRALALVWLMLKFGGMLITPLHQFLKTRWQAHHVALVCSDDNVPRGLPYSLHRYHTQLR